VKHPYLERRSPLELVELARPHWANTSATEDGRTFWRWECDRMVRR
jgi:hypothetical protein